MSVSSRAATFSPETVRLCEEILPRVSRTFALTIPMLREPLRTEVGLSYLLFRLVDSIEDHPDLEEPARNHGLALLAAWSADPGDVSLARSFRTALPPHPVSAYQDLIQRAAEVLAAREELSPAARRAVDACWYEMIAGMALFPGRRRGTVISVCPDLGALERYCHVVAGTVGVLLTELFGAHLEPSWLDAARRGAGKRFGIGLQLTNVVKDRGADRDRGLCYLPPAYLEAGPGTPLTARGRGQVVRRALDHLDAAHAYILSLPADRTDMRRFCLLAQLLALATLEVVCRQATPAPKVGRDDVARTAAWVMEAAGDDTAVRKRHRLLRGRVLAALDPSRSR